MTDFDGSGRRPKTSELEVLVAVAASGSFSRAASELGCTQSRISHVLGEMETRVGAKLFHRSRTGATPTAVGAIAVSRAREILQRLDTLLERDLAGVVRVAAYRSVATHLLTPALLDIESRHPRIRVEVDDSCEERADVERRVRDGSADLGVAHEPIGAGLSALPFAHDHYVAVVRRDRAPSDRGDLWAHVAPLPLFELRCSGARLAVEACRRDGMKNKTVATFASDSTVLAQVMARRGLAILPRLAAEPMPIDLVALPLPIQALRSLALLRRRGRSDAALVTVQRELLRAVTRPGFSAARWLHQGG